MAAATDAAALPVGPRTRRAGACAAGRVVQPAQTVPGAPCGARHTRAL